MWSVQIEREQMANDRIIPFRVGIISLTLNFEYLCMWSHHEATYIAYAPVVYYDTGFYRGIDIYFIF